MVRVRLWGAAFAATAAIASAGVALSAGMGMGMSPQQTVRALAGTWTCVTQDAHHKTWRETDRDTMYGPWLRMDDTYPAQNGQAADTGLGFFGYDGKHHRWIVGSFDTSGGYSVSYSNSATFNGSHWSDGYPAQGGSATVMMPSASRYTISSNGPMGVAHTVCTRG